MIEGQPFKKGIPNGTEPIAGPNTLSESPTTVRASEYVISDLKVRLGKLIKKGEYIEKLREAEEILTEYEKEEKNNLWGSTWEPDPRVNALKIEKFDTARKLWLENVKTIIAEVEKALNIHKHTQSDGEKPPLLEDGAVLVGVVSNNPLVEDNLKELGNGIDVNSNSPEVAPSSTEHLNLTEGYVTAQKANVDLSVEYGKVEAEGEFTRIEENLFEEEWRTTPDYRRAVIANMDEQVTHLTKWIENERKQLGLNKTQAKKALGETGLPGYRAGLDNLIKLRAELSALKTKKLDDISFDTVQGISHRLTEHLEKIRNTRNERKPYEEETPSTASEAGVADTEEQPNTGGKEPPILTSEQRVFSEEERRRIESQRREKDFLVARSELWRQNKLLAVLQSSGAEEWPEYAKAVDAALDNIAEAQRKYGEANRALIEAGLPVPEGDAPEAEKKQSRVERILAGAKRTAKILTPALLAGFLISYPDTVNKSETTIGKPSTTSPDAPIDDLNMHNPAVISIPDRNAGVRLFTTDPELADRSAYSPSGIAAPSVDEVREVDEQSAMIQHDPSLGLDMPTPEIPEGKEVSSPGPTVGIDASPVVLPENGRAFQMVTPVEDRSVQSFEMPALEVPEPLPHMRVVVQKNDNLTKLSEGAFADLMRDLSPEEKEHVIGRAIEEVRAMGKSARDRIGITSSTIDLIFPTDTKNGTLDLTLVREKLLEQIDQLTKAPYTIITPDAVEAFKNNYEGGEIQWERDLDTFVRTILPKKGGEGWMSNWFSVGQEAPGDIYEHLKSSEMTIGYFNALRDGDARAVRSYLRPLDISIADFRDVQKLLYEIGMSKQVQISDSMKVADVIEAAFVLSRAGAEVK